AVGRLPEGGVRHPRPRGSPPGPDGRRPGRPVAAPRPQRPRKPDAIGPPRGFILVVDIPLVRVEAHDDAWEAWGTARRFEEFVESESARLFRALYLVTGSRKRPRRSCRTPSWPCGSGGTGWGP